VILLLAAVLAAEPPSTPDSKERLVSEPASFTDGPLCQPADALLAWLEGSEGKRLRLPISVRVSPLGVSRGTVGDGPGALEVRLDSGALSMTLGQHVQRHCGSASPCLVWMEGTWGPLVDGPPQPPGPPVFAVRDVLGPVEGSAAQRAQIQGG